MIVPNDGGDCFAKTARNDTGLDGYEKNLPFCVGGFEFWKRLVSRPSEVGRYLGQ